MYISTYIHFVIKAKRHQAILTLIQKKTITSQADLLADLNKQGCQLTQATLSRDLTELCVTKKGGAYQTPPFQNTTLPFGGIQSITSVTGPFLILKTTSGLANGVAEWIDVQGFKEVAGTIAGDNTILIALTDQSSPQKFIQKITGSLAPASSRARRRRSV